MERGPYGSSHLTRRIRRMVYQKDETIRRAKAQPPQGTETVGAGPNVQAQPVCRDSGNRRSRTRVHSPLPPPMARKRRAISIKSGKCRTSPRTRANFTVLDATIISSAPNNTNTNDHTNNAMEDFMNPHAVPAAANPAIAQRGTCTHEGELDLTLIVHGLRRRCPSAT